VSDLLLCAAICQGQPEALQIFERSFMPLVRATIVRRTKGATVDLDDLVQELHCQLVVNEVPRGPLLAKYNGRGPLSAWLRIVATRFALKKRNQASANFDMTELEDYSGVITKDTELAYLRASYRSAFEESLSEALGTLSDRQRTLLRLKIVSRLSPDEIAKIYLVHRTTIVRWLADAQRKVHSETRQALMRRLSVGLAELSSILRVVRTELPRKLRSRLRAELANDDN
jgi:RNA polymerase sigma-70 factor (ECF subfamily)